LRFVCCGVFASSFTLLSLPRSNDHWIPACAGMTMWWCRGRRLESGLRGEDDVVVQGEGGWSPACAGKTMWWCREGVWIPAYAGMTMWFTWLDTSRLLPSWE
jgi:hypothetical protein